MPDAPAAPDLPARLRALAAAKAEHDAACTAAWAAVMTKPAEALALLDAALHDGPPLQREELALIAESGADAGITAAASAAFWRTLTLELLEGRRGAALMLADAAETARTRAMAAAMLAPDDPSWASVWETDAETATDPQEAARLLDAALNLRLGHGEALAAGRNRAKAASLAAGAGQMARARQCAQAAMAIARQHDLRREQVTFRIQRFQSLLIADQAGLARQEAKAELDFASRPSGALPDTMERLYADGLLALEGPAAAATADAFGLTVGPALRSGAPCAREAAAAALRDQRDEQRLEILLLAAQAKGRLGDWDTPAEDILPLALPLAATPWQRGRVYGAMADAAEGLGDTAGAVRAMEQAVAALQPGPAAKPVAQAEARLAALRGDAEALRNPAMDADDYATRRSDVAIAALQAGRAEAALAVLDGLAGLACSDSLRGKLATVRGVALSELGRLEVAALAYTEAAAVFETALDADPDGEGDWVGQRETALLLLAVTLARLERPREAWVAAERARSAKLVRALGLAAPDWPATRAALAAHRASVLSVQALRRGTLVLSAAPGEAEPQALVLEGFHSADLARLLVRDLGDDSDAWNGVLMDAIPGLSAGLAAPLAGRLRALAAADILYLIPDGALWYAPWAALEVAPGEPLAALVPLSLLPCARLLCACPPGAAPRDSVLALAVGHDNDGYAFGRHLDVWAPALAGHAARLLPGDAATAAALRQGGGCDLVVVSCHGTIDHATPELDRSSRLILADGTLAARQVAGWALGPGLGAGSLTLLNACQSGRFRVAARTELGGFPAALLRAGRRTLVAPLTHVDPHAAGALTASFLAAYLGGPPGASAARALQAARLALRASGAPPSDWAAHTMFGPDA